MSADQVIETLKLSVEEVMQVLLVLELDGLLSQEAGEYRATTEAIS